MRQAIATAIRSHVQVPAHIHAIAGAVAADLLFGPRYCPDVDPEQFDADDVATFPEDVESGKPVQLYSSRAAEALREFLSDLPSTLYVDEEAGCVIGESEPDQSETCWECDGEGEKDEEPCGKCNGSGTVEYCLDEIYRVDGREIVESLFGATIAREFN